MEGNQKTMRDALNEIVGIAKSAVKGEGYDVGPDTVLEPTSVAKMFTAKEN